MANTTRDATRRAFERKYLRHFFWNGQLHKVLHVNRPANLVDAWNYAEDKRVTLLYSDYRIHAKAAVRSGRAAQILNMTKRSLLKSWAEGHIEPPPIVPLANSDRYMRLWGEEHIMAAHDYFLSLHRGRPRKDGYVRPSKSLPSKAEVRALLNNTTVFYVKDSDGEFIPVWEPPKF